MTDQELKGKRCALNELLWSFREDSCLYPERDCKYQQRNAFGEIACNYLDGLLRCLKSELSSLGVVIADKYRHVVGAYLADEEKAEYYYACYPLEEK